MFLMLNVIPLTGKGRCTSATEQSTLSAAVSPAEDIARFRNAGLFALIANTVPTAFWMVYRISRAVDVRDGICTINVGQIKTACPTLVSTFQEVFLVHGMANSVRVATEDHHLDSGRYLIKKGGLVMMPASVQHHLRGIWGEDVDKFDHRRFIHREGEPRPNPAAFRGFGGGTTLCPGRHFATAEILVWTAMLLLRFDLVPAAVDTGCSSGLNALHLACQTLRNGEATMGLVGGCNLFYGADSIATLAQMNFLSPDGVCYSFDHRANGYSRGEGFGFVVLKMLSDALRDGDTIRAVIRATGSNQTAAHRAHGTGTPVGDPLEARAMAAVFKDERSVEQPLIVGAVKSNIGHLEGASGIAGLIKATLMLEHGVIPPNIWFEKPNPKIAPEWNLKFPTNPMLWPDDGPRRASVNSFGYGGTNTHAILDDAYHYLESRNLQGHHHTVQRPSLPEYPIVESDKAANGTLVGPPARVNGENTNTSLSKQSSAISRRKRLFVFSSYDEDGLRRIADGYIKELDLTPPADENAFLRDLAFTLGCKRSVFSWKSFTTATTCSELRENLQGSLSKPIRSSGVPMIGFVFTGQGAQWHAMGRELIAYPVYRKAFEDADNLGFNDLVIVGMVDLLKACGIQPAAVVGHSSGEIAAAYSAGGISKESAWRLSYFRGVVSSTLARSTQSEGAMLAAQLSEADVQPYLDRAISSKSDYVTVGCINSPKSVTLSGARDTIIKIHRSLREDNIFCQILKVENAYHSKYMDQVSAEYKELWPHGALRRPVKDILGTLPKATSVIYDTFLARYHAASDTFLEALGRLFCQGLSFNMQALNMIDSDDSDEVEMLIDVPGYPFNHSQRYWLESRISKNQRFRKHPPHEFLGTQVPDWNPSEARWRKYIPAGMLAMAIEAARQIADPERKITGFRIKEAVFDKALIVPTTSEGVEIQFYLQSSRISNFAASPSWSNFKLCSYENGDWLDHCRGSIMVELEGSPTTEDGKHEKQRQQEQNLEIARGLYDGCNISVESKSFYETLDICGLGFGSSFQTLHSIRYNMNQEATALVQIGDKFRPTTTGTHIIHPTTLDGVLQSVFPALTKGGQDAIQTLVPTFVQDLWISSGICDASIESLRVCTTGPNEGVRPTPSPDKQNENVEFGAFFFISKALAHVDLNKTVPPTEHLREYVGWMRHQVERYNNGSLVHGKPEWSTLIDNEDYMKEVLEDLSTSHYGMLLLRIGPNLSSILDGEVDALQLLFHDDLVTNVYRSGLGADISAVKIQRYVNTLAYKNPDLKILEIGAGTGGTTAPILKALSRHGEDEAGAASFFERAKEEFRDHGDRMSFKVLDIEQDPVEQGFAAGEYDLIVAANVLHATASLDLTLRNARKLLKPNGKIMLFEVCNPDAIRSALAFGLLPGWWQSIEPNRRWGPLIYESDWDEVLRRNDFTGNEICLRDWEDARNHMTTIMVSSATNPDHLKPSKPVPETIIIADDNSPFQRAVADETRKRLVELGALDLSVSICDPRTACEISVDHKLCIFLPELDRPFLAHMTTEEYACLQHVVASNNVLWVTHSSPQNADNLESELVVGFARALRSENTLLRFTTVAIESPEVVANTAAKVIQATTLNNHGPDGLSVEDEFMEKDGLICINRVVEANYLNDDIARHHATQRAEPHALSTDRPVKLTIASPGLLDTLQFVDDTEVDLPLQDDQVEVEVKATGMNFVDLMNALAQISGNFLGAECAGVVTRAGKATRFKPGDRVWAATIDAYRTLARAHDSLVQLMPAGLSFEEAASLPSVYGTCYYALGQSNYAAGNAYQDALARHRVLHGEKAISLNLGMILSVGFVAERPDYMSSLTNQGFRPIRETEFLGMLEYYCNPRLSLTSLLRAQVTTGLETPASLKARGLDEAYWMPRPLFRNLYQMDHNIAAANADTASAGGANFAALLGAVTSMDEAGVIVTDALSYKLAKTLSIPRDEIDPQKPMHSYGVDSLVAVEMRNWLAKELKADVAVFELMSNTSIAGIGSVVAGKSRLLSIKSDAAGKTGTE
ncbi:hypothetical protein B0T22DRAFT_439466 [Podospora appendiculata]|uniref:Polyketide synthase n=1 Tax=Podospora appendiculata TaxID=314037 RepID=A0AAE1CBW8_9PEZI|nr:hypothetical protein B0T22DRAFT_439466 [Podospora appendiculata]